MELSPPATRGLASPLLEAWAMGERGGSSPHGP
jgi:hypothetical protein